MSEVRRYDYRRRSDSSPKSGWGRGEWLFVLFIIGCVLLALFGVWLAGELGDWLSGAPAPAHADAPNIDP